MPFKRHNKNEDHLPAAQREDAEAETSDTEGQAVRPGRHQGDEYLPPSERGASDDGGSDTEGQAYRSGR
jgi:hypothetical protein